MKSGLLSIAILFLITSINGYCQQWIKIYSDSVDLLPLGVIEAYDKGYIFAGQKFFENSYYGWIMKTDINGNMLWSKSYGISQKMNQFNSARLTSDGGGIYCGGTNKLSTSCSDPLLVKVNACGDKEWCKVYKAPGCNSWAPDVGVITEDGYLLLITQWKSEKEERIWLFRLDSLGEVIWAQAYATDPAFSSEVPFSLLKTTDSCMLITGRAYYPDLTYPNKSIIKIILIKVTLDGEVIFEVPWGTDNGVYSDGRLSVIDTKNNIYTAGRRARTEAPYGDSPSLFRTSSMGNPVFYKDLKTNSTLGESGTINWFQDSTLVQCIGWFDESGADSTAVIKTDSTGDFIKEKFMLLNEDDMFRASDITFNNRLLLSGSVYNHQTHNWQGYAFKFTSELEYDSVYTTPFTYDSLCPHPIVSDTISLDDCQSVVVGIDDPVQNPEKTRLHIYPNPAGSKITVEMPNYLVRQKSGSGISATTWYYKWKSVRLDVFDLHGKLMYSNDIARETKEINLDISAWPGGMYLARIVVMNEVVAGVKFVKQ